MPVELRVALERVLVVRRRPPCTRSSCRGRCASLKALSARMLLMEYWPQAGDADREPADEHDRPASLNLELHVPVPFSVFHGERAAPGAPGKCRSPASIVNRKKARQATDRGLVCRFWPGFRAAASASLDTEPHDPVRGPHREGAGRQSRRRHRAAAAGLRVLGLRAQGPGPPVRRAVPGPPAGGRRHPGRSAPGRRRDRRRPAARHRRGHAEHRSRRSASCSASRSRTSSRASPSCPPCSSRRARSGRPRASARCSWRWSTTSASSS